jgi:hypothetical protein
VVSGAEDTAANPVGKLRYFNEWGEAVRLCQAERCRCHAANRTKMGSKNPNERFLSEAGSGLLGGTNF